MKRLLEFFFGWSQTRKLLIYSISTMNLSVVDKWPEFINGYRLYIYKPKLLNLNQYGDGLIVNLLWYLASMGRFSILVLLDNETVVHYSYITPKVFRFSFMGKKDQQIGPCVTHADYRGKGIFTSVLRLIPAYFTKQCDYVWTYTTQDDIAAQKAFKKAGYMFYSFAEMSLRTKIVRLIS